MQKLGAGWGKLRGFGGGVEVGDAGFGGGVGALGWGVSLLTEAKQKGTVLRSEPQVLYIEKKS